MKVLITGVSSFTGFHFAKKLASSGHNVVGTLTRLASHYEGIQAQRVLSLREMATIATVEGQPFGAKGLFPAIARHEPEVFCFHHSEAGAKNRSPDFDWAGAFSRNTADIDRVFWALNLHGCKRVVYTNSYYGSSRNGVARQAFNLYGLSKDLTRDTVEFFCRKHGLAFSEIVVPNPWGVFEDERTLTSAAMRTWKKRETFVIETPRYIRDNIMAPLLAKFYVKTVESASPVLMEPGQSMGSILEFVEEMAEEVSARTGLPCAYMPKDQTELNEPFIINNSHDPKSAGIPWSGRDSTLSWDAYVDWQMRR